jgi:hypothetical protein
MSLELIAVIGTALGVGLAALQVWQGRRRRAAHLLAPDPAAQNLREEAVTALTDAAMSAGEVHPGRQGANAAALKSLGEHYRTLARLRSRMRIASGISEPEVDAFTDAAQAFVVIAEIAREFREMEADILPEAIAEMRFDEEETRLSLECQNLSIAMRRFEEVVRELASQKDSGRT